MKKLIAYLFFIAPFAVEAQNDWVVPSIDGNAPFFSSEPSYNENEKRALDVNQKILDENLLTRQAGGAVEFVYGHGMPVVICSPLRLCDIALETGETVKDVMVGDTRWSVQPSLSGKPPNHQIHAIVKPGDVGLVTSLMISTHRRVYNVTLKSSADKYMPQVSFTYPASGSQRAWGSFIDEQEKAARQAEEERLMIKTAVAKREAEESAELIEKESVPPRLGVDIDSINFDYKISGKPDWKPLRVFDDGIHTVSYTHLTLPTKA